MRAYFQPSGLSGILCQGPVDRHSVTNRSWNWIANWVFASVHSLGCIFHCALIPTATRADSCLGFRILSRHDSLGVKEIRPWDQPSL